MTGPTTSPSEGFVVVSDSGATVVVRREADGRLRLLVIDVMNHTVSALLGERDAADLAQGIWKMAVR